MADSSSTRTSKLSKLTFRFAMDEIDAVDIAAVVNEAYSVECVSEGEYTFRLPCPKITAAEIESNLLESGCKARWLVLETPVEEDVVAAGRFVLDFNSRFSVVDIMCATGDSSEVCASRVTHLVTQLESIVYSHGMTALIIEVSSVRTDVQQQLTNLGYEDRGGRVFDDVLCLQPTMILEFKKELRTGMEGRSAGTGFECERNSDINGDLDVLTSSLADMADGTSFEIPSHDIPSFDFTDCEVDFTSFSPQGTGTEGGGNGGHEGGGYEGQEGVDSSGGGGSMEALMSQLFTALHSEKKEG